MSQINDALKRASQTDKRDKPPSAGPDVMLPSPARRSATWPLFLGVAVILLGTAAIWIFCRLVLVNRASPPTTTIVAAPVTPPPAAMPVRAPTPTPIAAAPVVPVAHSNPVTPVAGPVTNAPPPFPSIKLQAIFYARSNPRALINGETFAEGDNVAGTRIKQIEPANVTIEWNGQTKTFHLQGP